MVLLSRRPANDPIIAANDNSAPMRGTAYGYDASGDLTGFTDAPGNTTAWGFRLAGYRGEADNAYSITMRGVLRPLSPCRTRTLSQILAAISR